MKRKTFASLACAATLLLAGTTVSAGTQTVLKISEVVAGTYADHTIQYVQLRIMSAAATPVDLTGYNLVLRDISDAQSASTPLGATFNGNQITNTTPGSTIMMATAATANFFGIYPDFILFPNTIPHVGGSLCVENPNGGLDDCFVWGAYPSTGTFWGPNNTPFNPNSGLTYSTAAQRFEFTSQVFSPALAANANSTGSYAQFWLAPAIWPENNIGAVGQWPGSVCGNGTVEGIEQCDDHNTTSGDGCSNTCKIENQKLGYVCGNGTLEGGEQCDDGNTQDQDGCSSRCMYENFYLEQGGVCGDGYLQTGEQCDDGANNGANGDFCTALCVMMNSSATCGNASLEMGEQCDDGNTRDGDGCSSICQWETSHTSTCGNFVVEPGEQCDYTAGPGCTSACQIDDKVAFHCGPYSQNNQSYELDPNEQCDHGPQNGTDGICTASCTWVNPPANPNFGNSFSGTGTTVTTSTTTGVTAGYTATTTAGASTGSTGSSTTAGATTAGSSTSTGTSGGSSTGSTNPLPPSSCTAVTPDTTLLLGLVAGILLALRFRRPVPVPVKKDDKPAR